MRILGQKGAAHSISVVVHLFAQFSVVTTNDNPLIKRKLIPSVAGSDLIIHRDKCANRLLQITCNY